jgi:phosphoglucosamine mutase
VGESPITPDFILKLGWAVGRVLAGQNGGRVVIGKDTRISGYMFESALEAGLSAAGVDIHLLGPMPTPAIAYLTRTMHAKAGIVISASHNPYDDNGIKFFSGAGIKLPDDIELAIEAELDKDMACNDSAHLGKAVRVVDAAGRYIEFCKSTIPPRTELNALKVVIDCANGATYHVAPSVFRELGARVTTLGTQPNGLNINKGLGSTHIEPLRTAVVEQSADLGIAFDGDGDRVIMVDADGNVVDGDELLFIIASDRHQDGHLYGGVIGTQMSNLGLEHALDRAGISFKRAAVGDRYVMDLLTAEGWLLGGESSGHIICLDRTTTGDGIVAALQVVSAMVRRQKSLNELRKGLTKYPQHMINVRLTERFDPAKNVLLESAVREVEDELNGAGRVLLRPSGTEPVIRVMVEGQDGRVVHALAEQLADAVRNALTA